MEQVRVCRSCGHIDPADSRGRCPTCGVFLDFVVVTRPEAEHIVRQRRHRLWRRRLLRLGLGLAVVGACTVWALGAYLDLGPSPPSPTTAISASLGPQTWPQIGRTPENTGFIPEDAPFPQQVAWTYRTTKPLLASPAIVDGHVYLATGDGRSLALDRHSGQPVWEFHTGWLSSSTPAVAGEMVIFATRPGRMVALDRHTGAVRWDVDLKQPILASPVVVNGTVYIGSSDRNLYALDVATGRQRWVFASQDWIVSAVAYAGDRVIVASQDSRLHVVGAETGRQRLIYETGSGRHIGAAPAVHGDRVYFGSVGGRVWALDWRHTTYPLERFWLFWQTHLYLWGMRATSPVQKGSIWIKRLKGEVRHTPAIAHDTVYVTANHGQVIALDAAGGAERWRSNIGMNITTSPTIAGAVVLVGTESGVVVGLQAHTGERLWEFKTEGQITARPVVAGGTLYIASHHGGLSAITTPQ